MDKFLGDTAVENFVGIGQSNAAILTSTEIQLSVAVLLTIIKKMFFQAGGGRKEAAFYRGLDHRAKAYVPEILEILQRHGFIEKSGRSGHDVWLACKQCISEAKSIRDAPMTNKHPVVNAVRQLGS